MKRAMSISRAPGLGRRWGLRVVALAAAICAMPGQVSAQEARVQGIVISASTVQPLEGVVVSLDTGGEPVYTALTDRNGFYQLGGVRSGTYSLRAVMLGYLDHRQQLTIAAGERLTVSMRLEINPVTLEGITVEGQKSAAAREPGRRLVLPSDIRMVPVPAGSGDLATYIQTLPGVVSVGDRGGQVFVRGGTPAENLVLVDGIPIFHPFHIVGFFSVFPEGLVAGADFYAGGFGARYQDRTSSVLDVRLRDGNEDGTRVTASASPFLVEAKVDGNVGSSVRWLASARRSLVEETSDWLIGEPQPLSFESQLLKVTAIDGQNRRCSALALRTSDLGRLDAEEKDSRVAWENLLFGGRCLTQFTGPVRLFEVSFSYSSATNRAVSRGSSAFRSKITRVQHEAHATGMIGALPLNAGYETYLEVMDYDLSELFGLRANDHDLFGASGYIEADMSFAERLDIRPGVVLALSPLPGIQPRVRANYQPWGRPSERVQAALGLYQQNLVGTSDTRDVSSVFTAWMSAPSGAPLKALHAILGWHQSLGGSLRWSLEGYYKQLRHIPVPVWDDATRFTTKLTRADGRVHGADLVIEYTDPRFHAFLGYGYGWTRYEASQREFASWFGEPVQRYHPPHDRRHQLNTIANLDLAGFELSSRWQLGSGLPFTRPMGFVEEFNFGQRIHDVREGVGITRLVVDRPLTGRLPLMHRLDLSVEREVQLSFGTMSLQAGVINAYDRRNVFYYDLYSTRRVDQLRRAPYLAVEIH